MVSKEQVAEAEKKRALLQENIYAIEEQVRDCLVVCFSYCTVQTLIDPSSSISDLQHRDEVLGAGQPAGQCHQRSAHHHEHACMHFPQSNGYPLSIVFCMVLTTSLRHC